MNSTAAAVSAYRALLRLYPRSVRDEYGADMAALFSNQLHDEPAWRVCTRGVVDLALTVPTWHLEARMNRPPTRLVSVLLGSIALAALLLTIVVANPGILVFTLPVAVAAGALAVLDRRRNGPVPPQTTGRWWKLLAAGASLLAGVVVITTATGELDSSGTWTLMMLALLTSFVLMAAGVILGVARLAGRGSLV